ncbi:hypothetical protein F3Y22_tig00009023pilonHSYRG00059 [Hibiscus syriacus]|uniref:Uncharacterized protein n=1 Tax=Hibiscus syriacus TaxID=106335 RepID=A0A6A3CCX8_HIBSY|nr:hypothetical protein F3Y22_tig00009023pilonHSYRG00059 [Hibiscus syriacus]
MQPGSGETHLFFPDCMGDELIVEVQDSKGKHLGRILVQVAADAKDLTDKLRWWSVYREPEHEPLMWTAFASKRAFWIGVLCAILTPVAKVMAKRLKHTQNGPNEEHITINSRLCADLPTHEFALRYGVSVVYTKLRYLSYVMDVATLTSDCLRLVHELLVPVVMKGHTKGALTHQENYKSLDESSFSGIMDVFKPATGLAEPSLEPAVKLYTLLHDILSPEAQTNLCHYFQAAARNRSRRHLAETDEFVTTNDEPNFLDPFSVSTAYQNMACRNIKNEILTATEIHNQHIFPSFIDLPNLSASIYSTELCSRLRAFLLACPPSGPSPPVVELIIETADFQRDLSSWNISHVKGGVDAKELFHLYIMIWIQDNQQSLLESCKLDKVKWSGVGTQHSTTPFIDEIVCASERPFSYFDVEKEIVEALDKQYADAVSPLKENLLGILLNSMKRVLDVLRPKIDTQFKSWGSCIPDGGKTAPGERFSEVTVMLRTKFRGYLQAVVEKLAENTLGLSRKLSLIFMLLHASTTSIAAFIFRSSNHCSFGNSISPEEKL